jgi:hypothetical protein
MTSRGNLPAADPPPSPLPARLVSGARVHIPRQAMFGAVRDLDVEVIWFRPTGGYNLGWLRCAELATGRLCSLWVRPRLITVCRVLPVFEYREAC